MDIFDHVLLEILASFSFISSAVLQLDTNMHILRHVLFASSYACHPDVRKCSQIEQIVKLKRFSLCG